MIVAREYQTRALNEARVQYASGGRAVLLVAPTGAGKTTIAGLAVVGAVQRGLRVCFSAHRRELIDQTVRRFRDLGLEVGCRGQNAAAKVQVTSPQVILARREMPEADLFIPDEAHHYVSEEWGQIPRAYLKSGAKILGLSATPERGDGIGLGEAFDRLVVVAQIEELTELGWLVPCEVIKPKVTVRALAMDPHEAYQRWGEGRPAVVFAPHVKAATEFRDSFRDAGIDAEVVHGALDEESRDGALARFARGDLNVLTNVMVLTEGWDSPRAKVCMLARKIGSASLYLQKVGRVLRPLNGRAAPGEIATVIDLAGNYELHGHPAEPRKWSLTGEACTRWGGKGDGVRFCRVCKSEMPADSRVCECGVALPEQVTPRGEGVELERIIAREEKQEARAALPEDKRLGILRSLYAKGIRKGRKKRGAEMAYKSMMGRWPDTKLMVSAWREANELVAQERGDAYEPPITAEG